MMRTFLHSGLVVLLTLLSQIGGIAWLAALLFKRRLVAFAIIYGAMTIAALFVAPTFGRVALSCQNGSPLQMQSWMYCALNRQYVTPEMQEVALDLAAKMEEELPGTITLALDGGFPFISGFPLLPHLSHHDGRKLDLAFFYRNETQYLPSVTRSPIGYFAFEQGPTDCPETWLSLRWDLNWLQGFWRELKLDDLRMRTILKLIADDERIGKVFLEPHLQEGYEINHPKFRFQGCRAARHDDHIHIQL